ncbi:hypothetical protein [Treponema endosymbiont of Eucomonympha sp.]|uniref:hypothetical protein n=1 Tax=Treponema endosymbiont of Eucomonympha sp. TaxID=1580831 RepID=UPI00165039D6|nr:hypothetical protein [Treponema endosymbiont of Eucomonympha sp.]
MKRNEGIHRHDISDAGVGKRTAARTGRETRKSGERQPLVYQRGKRARALRGETCRPNSELEQHA